MVRRAVKFLGVLAAIEAMFWAFGMISIRTGNPYYLYRPALLEAQIASNLPAERAGSETGWPASGKAPPRSDPTQPACGSAWGGSFTYADDVSESEAWPGLLSKHLGCHVDNRGEDGFATDQTLLLFQQHPPQQSLVVLGVAPPMISTDGAASWTFLSLDDHQPKAALTKPFFTLGQNDQLHLIKRPVPEVGAIEHHYLLDRYSEDWTALRFPFTISVARAIWRKFTIPRQTDFDALDHEDPIVAQWRAVAERQIEEMAKIAISNGDRFVVLFIPQPDRPGQPGFPEAFSRLKVVSPQTCIIDGGIELKQIDPSKLRSKSGHYTAVGNQALLRALVRGLSACGISA